MNVMVVAGVGCRRGCEISALQCLLETVLDKARCSFADLTALATLETKKYEPGILLLAQQLNVPLHFFSAVYLAAYHDRLQRPSPKVLMSTGSAGIAEAAALALSEAMTGAQAQLIVPKHSNAVASIALAGVHLYENRS